MEPRSTWVQAEQAFAAALSQPEPLREAFVRERWAAAPDVRDEVLKLLAAQARMGGFLESRLLDFRGHRFGAYVAGEEIGRGGMSVVYSGHRVDGDFEKKVAIKVVLTPIGTAPEAQILASSQHPNIARLFDAGVTELGLRYLVMEYVEGVPCTEFRPEAGEREKLRLFVQVCHAVQAAHHSLVVHRDLKPENILITADGTPKLLDFGIAKMLEPAALQTGGLQAFTLNYASPEQVRRMPVSTLDDIYSLGVILCEWVGGRLPRRFGGSSPADLLRQFDAPPDIPLGGDLGAMARRALEPRPEDRYESAGALARDIERYLAGEPVHAQPRSWTYVAGKFVRRHALAVAAAALALTLTAGTASYAVWQRRLAQHRFNQVRSLSQSVMFELHDALAPLEGSARARAMIADRSLAYLDTLARDRSLTDEVALEAARGYLRIAEVRRALGTDARDAARKAAAMAGRVNSDAARAVRDAAAAF